MVKLVTWGFHSGRHHYYENGRMDKEKARAFLRSLQNMGAPLNWYWVDL